MECKDFVREIPAFLEKNMDYNQLKIFCEHAVSCAECKEELTIQFLISEGISHLEAGDAFDLNKELNQRMQDAERQLKHYKKVHARALCLQLCGGLFVLAAVVALFI